jgi:hypothetical protein
MSTLKRWQTSLPASQRDRLIEAGIIVIGMVPVAMTALALLS